MADIDKKIIVKADPDLKDMIPRFLDNRKKDVEIIQKSLTENKLDVIQSLAHGMKGCGTSYGFEPITLLGALIELAAKNADTETIREKTEELSDYLKRVEVVYE